MAGFRDIKTLQKFASVHASIHNHFNQDRHLNRRDIFKQYRSAALAEWRQLAARASRLRELWRLVRIRLTAPQFEFIARRQSPMLAPDNNILS